MHFREGERGDWLDIELGSITTTVDVKFDANARTDNRVRLQNDTLQAWDITTSGRTVIAPFVGAYADESKPQIAITSPSGGSVVTGVVNVLSHSYDLGGMQSLELYVDTRPRREQHDRAVHAEYLDSTAVTSGPLQTPSGPAVQGNGVLSCCSSGCFPTEADDNFNYWVDVVFRP